MNIVHTIMLTVLSWFTSSRLSQEADRTQSIPSAIVTRWGRNFRVSVRAALFHRAQMITDAAREAGVDPFLAVSICWMESGLRLRNRMASLCGCQPYATSDEEQVSCMVRSLRTSLRVCGSTDGAVSRYVWGRCELATGTSARQQHWRAHVEHYLMVRERVQYRIEQTIAQLQ
jgi:hypothetical protein